MNKEQHEKIKELLTRSFATVDTDPCTGKRVETRYVSRDSYLAEYEVDRLSQAIMESIASDNI